MTEDDLAHLIENYIVDSLGYSGDELSQDRETALDYYFGRPFGNEVEGLSKVVSRDVSDTIEWMLPSLLRVFTSNEDYVRFDPVGQEDEEQAAQETAVVNYVIHSQNPGFRIFHDWFKDALLSKTGIATWWWDKTDQIKHERYTGLTDDEYTGIVGQDGTEVVERTEREESVEQSQQRQAQAAGIDPNMLPQVQIRHDVLVKRVVNQAKLRVEVVAPEEFLIHKDARDLETGLFSAHMSRMTISGLRQMGITDDVLNTLSVTETSPMAVKGSEELARDNYSETDAADRSIIDEATKRVWVFFCYVRTDFDGDGHAELRRVVYCQGKILENDYTDAVRYADLCPIRTPHRFVGQSIADLVMDLQKIKSELWRQGLNNLYLANNPQKGVITGAVEFDDLLRPRIGGLVRMTRPDAVTPIVTPDMSSAALQMLEYSDTVKENRTGVTRYNQGLHTDTLNKTKGGMEQILNQAQQRIELIARIFAETGIKRLMSGIHDDLIRNQRKDISLKLRNKWVRVDPSSWRERSDMTVNVGLGTGNRDENVQHLMLLSQFQLAGTQAGIVLPENLFYTGKKLAESIGRKDAEQFFTDPQIIAKARAGQPPSPDPVQVQAQVDIAKEKIKGQIAKETTAVKMQADASKANAELAVEDKKLQLQAQEIQSKERIEAAWIASEELKHKQKLDADIQLALELEKIKQQAENERFARQQENERELNAAVKKVADDR